MKVSSPGSESLGLRIARKLRNVRAASLINEGLPKLIVLMPSENGSQVKLLESCLTWSHVA